jgi:hypothetical protein
MFDTPDQPDSLYDSVIELEEFIDTHFDDCKPNIKEVVDNILENLKDDLREANTANDFSHLAKIAHNKIVDIFNEYVYKDNITQS